MIPMAYPYPVLLVSLLFVLPTIRGTDLDQVVFRVINNATDTEGGERFSSCASTVQHWQRQMNISVFFVLNLVLNQNCISDRRQITEIRLYIDKISVLLISREYRGGIYVVLISEKHLRDFPENEEVAREVRWMFTFGIAIELQWFQEGDEPRALRHGIAAYAVLAAGYQPDGWAKAGEGKTWNEKYDVTGQLFVYINNTIPHFAAELNKKMKTSYSPSLVEDMTGKTIHGWWSEYKKAYAESLRIRLKVR